MPIIDFTIAINIFLGLLAYDVFQMIVDYFTWDDYEDDDDDFNDFTGDY